MKVGGVGIHVFKTFRQCTRLNDLTELAIQCRFCSLAGGDEADNHLSGRIFDFVVKEKH